MEIKERINQLIQELNHDVFEKEEITKLSLLSAIAGESVFLLGAPGVAKSLIARRLKFAFENSNSFEYLMNKFSTPDEIFGPVSIKKLKDEDKYERLTEKYLPNANVVFLDEIWKAGPSIQNTLLTILNEKKYRNGEQEIDCKIYGLISASNELPEKEQGLEALWDRFLIRYIVESISDKEKFNQMISGNLKSYEDTITPELKIKKEEIEEWSKEIDKVSVPQEVLNVIHFIRTKIQEYNGQDGKEGIYISDRRWRKIVRLLRTSAFLNERESIDLMDCFLISFCIWDEVEQLEFVKDLVTNTLKNHGYELNLGLNVIKQQIKEFNDNEVIEATQTVNEYEVEEPIIVKSIFYEIEGMTYQNQFNRILKSDFEKLSTTQQNFNFYNDSSGKHTMTAYLNGEDIMIATNNWDTCKLKAHIVAKRDVLYKPPTPLLKKAWDNQVKELVNIIQEKINMVNKHKNNQLAHLRTNLFVESYLADIVETNLNSIIKELGIMKLDVEKIKNYYDNIRQ
jgi:MoxR-like ATPase